jgi:hypothetical protein
MCYIKRQKKGFLKMYPEYELYLKEGDKYLLSARKRKKNKTSNYLISLDKNDTKRHTDSYFGKVRSHLRRSNPLTCPGQTLSAPSSPSSTMAETQGSPSTDCLRERS